MKSLYKYILIFVFLLSTCGIFVGCGTDDSKNDTYLNPQGLDFYLLDNDTYGVKIGNATELSCITIPEEYCKKPVTLIMESGFESSNDNLTKIIITKNIEVIENRAFYSCKNLTFVEFFEDIKLTKIGDSAFESCYKLSGITLPNSLTYIGNRAFLNTAIHQIIIPKNVDYIGAYAFSNNIENIEQSGFSWNFFCESTIFRDWDEKWNLIYDITLYKADGKKEKYKQIGSIYLYRSDNDILKEVDYQGHFWKYENKNEKIIAIWGMSDNNSWIVKNKYQIKNGENYPVLN